MPDDVKGARVDREQLMLALDRALRNVSGQAVLHSEAMAERLGINSTDLECLDIVVMQGPVSAGDLGRASGLTSGAITGVIDRLHRAGLAKREPDPVDRRKVLVRVPPAVLQRILPIGEPMGRAAQAILSSYDDCELALILDFLERSHQSAVAVTTRMRAETAALKKARAKPRKPRSDGRD
jgi:DNA-binding MarR family transcriptional regulator